MENKNKIILLWTVFLLGMIFHSLLAIMPVFWGQNIAMSEEMIAKNPIDSSMRMMLCFFLLPMVIIVQTLFFENKWYKITNFIFTLLFTLMNVWHLIGHFTESPIDPYQIALLTFVLTSGIILNIVSYKWIKE